MHSSMHKAKAVFALVPESSAELMKLKKRILECSAGELWYEIVESARDAIRLNKPDNVRTLLPLVSDRREAAEQFRLAAELGRPDCLVLLRPYYSGTMYDVQRLLHDRCVAGQSAEGRRVCLSLIQYWIAEETPTSAAVEPAAVAPRRALHECSERLYDPSYTWHPLVAAAIYEEDPAVFAKAVSAVKLELSALVDELREFASAKIDCGRIVRQARVKILQACVYRSELEARRDGQKDDALEFSRLSADVDSALKGTLGPSESYPGTVDALFVRVAKRGDAASARFLLHEGCVASFGAALADAAGNGQPQCLPMLLSRVSRAEIWAAAVACRVGSFAAKHRITTPASDGGYASCAELLERRAGELDVADAPKGIHGHL